MQFPLLIQDYSTCELNLSDTDLNDLFSEFDVNTNDFHTSTNDINYPQSISNLSLSYDTIYPISTNNNTQNLELVSSEVLSQNGNNSLIEQQSNIALSSFSMDYPEVIQRNICTIVVIFI